MKVKGFLILFGPEFGRFINKDGVEMKYDFNHKFFELEEEAEKSLEVSKAKAKKHNWNWDDCKIVRIDCEGKEL